VTAKVLVLTLAAVLAIGALISVEMAAGNDPALGQKTAPVKHVSASPSSAGGPPSGSDGYSYNGYGSGSNGSASGSSGSSAGSSGYSYSPPPVTSSTS
jgi:hypothetical protein